MGHPTTYDNPFRRIFDRITGGDRHDQADEGPQFDEGLQPREDRQPTSGTIAAPAPEREILTWLNDGTVIYKDEWQQLLASMNAHEKDYEGYSGSIDTIDGLVKAIRDIRAWESSEGDDFGGFVDEDGPTDFDSALAALFADLGKGSGRGRARPVYKAPDEATVREGLGLYVATVVGQGDDTILNEAVSIFMSKSRANFSSKGKTIDATTAAKNYIRGTAAYKDIHELRPENMDELRWVTSTQGALRKLGVSGQNAEQLGIELARAAASGEGIQKAGETAFRRQTGRIHTDQRNRLKAKASAAAGLL